MKYQLKKTTIINYYTSLSNKLHKPYKKTKK